LCAREREAGFFVEHDAFHDCGASAVGQRQYGQK
jgi:hypothetical protein